MGLFDDFKPARKTMPMEQAERSASSQQEGLEPLLLVLIEEVRQLRRELADERKRQRDAERGRGGR